MKKRQSAFKKGTFSFTMCTLLCMVTIISASQGCFNTSIRSIIPKNLVLTVDQPMLVGDQKKVQVMMNEESVEVNDEVEGISYQDYVLNIHLIEGQGKFSLLSYEMNGKETKEKLLLLSSGDEQQDVSKQVIIPLLKGMEGRKVNTTQEGPLKIKFKFQPDTTTQQMKVRIELLKLGDRHKKGSKLLTWQASPLHKEGKRTTEDNRVETKEKKVDARVEVEEGKSGASDEASKVSVTSLALTAHGVSEKQKKDSSPNVAIAHFSTVMGKAEGEVTQEAVKEATKEVKEAVTEAIKEDVKAEAKKVAESKKEAVESAKEAENKLDVAAKKTDDPEVKEAVERAKEAGKVVREKDKEYNVEIDRLVQQLTKELKKVGLAKTDEEIEAAEEKVKKAEEKVKAKLEESSAEAAKNTEMAEKERQEALQKLKEVAEKTDNPKVQQAVEKAEKAVEKAEKAVRKERKIVQEAYDSAKKIVDKISGMVGRAQESKKSADIRDRVLGSIIPSLIVSLVAAAVIGTMTTATMGVFGGIIGILVIFINIQLGHFYCKHVVLVSCQESRYTLLKRLLQMRSIDA
eukprot:gene243-323_t